MTLVRVIARARRADAHAGRRARDYDARHTRAGACMASRDARARAIARAREVNARRACAHLREALAAQDAMARAMREGFLCLALRRRFGHACATRERCARARVRVGDGRVVLVRVGGGGEDGAARAFEEALARAAEAADARARATAALGGANVGRSG